MSVISNLNSRQNPIAGEAVKWIACDRVYIKSTDSTPTPVVAKSNGVLPSGWTDLGVVNGKIKVQYSKDIKEIRTGIDEILRGSYVGKKTANFEFQLSQFDSTVITALSGVTASVITAGSITQFALGGEDIISKAILMVSQDKYTGREWQWYSPLANMTFELTDNSEETVVTGKASLPAFTYSSNDVYMIQTLFV